MNGCEKKQWVIHTKTETLIGELSENCGVMIRELFVPVSSAQENIDMEIFFLLLIPSLWASGWGSALNSKLLKSLDSDILSHYSRYEMTAVLFYMNCSCANIYAWGDWIWEVVFIANMRWARWRCKRKDVDVVAKLEKEQWRAEKRETPDSSSPSRRFTRVKLLHLCNICPQNNCPRYPQSDRLAQSPTDKQTKIKKKNSTPIWPSEVEEKAHQLSTYRLLKKKS